MWSSIIEFLLTQKNIMFFPLWEKHLYNRYKSPRGSRRRAFISYNIFHFYLLFYSNIFRFYDYISIVFIMHLLFM